MKYVVTAIVGFILVSCSDHGVAPAPPAPNNKSAGELINQTWQFQYSPNMPGAPARETGLVGWHFDFPSRDGVHYLVTGSNGLVPGAQTVALEYEITTTGTPVFDFRTAADNTCVSPPANVSFYMQRKGDNLSGEGDYANYRFWSRPLLSVLTAGSSTLTVPLLAAQWINVWGQNNGTGFSQTISNLQAIGMTFGGGCFAGHGVFVTGGTARFNAKSYLIK